MSSQLRIIVSGLVGLYPIGGVSWDYLQYVIGLARLGHDVYYHEDTWSWPYHPVEKTYTSEGNYSAEYIQHFFKMYAPELINRWHYSHLHNLSFGMTRASFDEIAKTADMFINLSGAGFIPEKLSSKCIKVFIDTDPGYNQIMLSEKYAWSENIERWCKIVAEHDVFLTYAENINGTDCLIPKVGFNWKTTRMPIVIDLWRNHVQKSDNQLYWTTVMTWNAFKGKLLYKGIEYKSKGSEFEKIIELPQHIKVLMKVAVGGVAAPREKLIRYGWNVIDGPNSTRTPYQYQNLIGQSRGEISIAKHVYVAMKSGWFSCRSACYLAAGKPVVIQDTGFSKVLPTGKGILAFENVKDAVEAIKEVEYDYDKNAKVARDLAEEYFSSNIVLSDLITKSMASE